jgi:hypothetical protein
MRPTNSLPTESVSSGKHDFAIFGFMYKHHEVDHDHEIGPNVLLHHSFTPGDY